MPTSTFVFGLGTAAVLLSGCGAAEQPDALADPVTVDSAGIRIIDNGRLPAPETVRMTTPRVSIGVIDGPAEYQLFEVTGARRLSDGAIALTNAGTRQLRIYEADGTHRVTVGGAGQGPGEFAYPIGLVVLPGDTIQVQDRLDRVRFAPDGAFLGRETADWQAFAELARAAGGFFEGGLWTGDGTLFAPIYRSSGNAPVAGPPSRPAMTLVRMAADFTRLDTLGRYGGALQQLVEYGDGTVRPTVPPFPANTSWAAGSSDGTMVIGDNAGTEVHRFHPDGTRSIVRWADEAEPVTDAEVEAWKDRQRNASWTQGRLPELERAWAALDLPDTKPFYGRVMAGSDGTLWLGPNDDPGATTIVRVFGSDGRYEGRLEFPGTFVVYDSGPGWVLGVSRDENEVEFLHLYDR